MKKNKTIGIRKRKHEGWGASRSGVATKRSVLLCVVDGSDPV